MTNIRPNRDSNPILLEFRATTGSSEPSGPVIHLGDAERDAGLVTFAPNPYLCMSADIDVTPGTRKSHKGTEYPSFSTLQNINVHKLNCERHF